MFAIHTEDYDMNSINYNHYGKPKFWYCVNSADAHLVKQYVKSKYPKPFEKCSEYMRHKTILINPYRLKEWNPSIRISKSVNQANSEGRRIHHNIPLMLSRGVQLGL